MTTENINRIMYSRHLVINGWNIFGRMVFWMFVIFFCNQQNMNSRKLFTCIELYTTLDIFSLSHGRLLLLLLLLRAKLSCEQNQLFAYYCGLETGKIPRKQFIIVFFCSMWLFDSDWCSLCIKRSVHDCLVSI